MTASAATTNIESNVDLLSRPRIMLGFVFFYLSYNIPNRIALLMILLS